MRYKLHLRYFTCYQTIFTKSNFISRANTFIYTPIYSIFIHYYNVGISRKYRLSLTAMRNTQAHNCITCKYSLKTKCYLFTYSNLYLNKILYSIFHCATLCAHNAWNRTNESGSQETGKHNNSNPQRFREVALAHEFIAVVI